MQNSTQSEIKEQILHSDDGDESTTTDKTMIKETSFEIMEEVVYRPASPLSLSNVVIQLDKERNDCAEQSYTNDEIAKDVFDQSAINDNITTCAALKG